MVDQTNETAGIDSSNSATQLEACAFNVMARIIYVMVGRCETERIEALNKWAGLTLNVAAAQTNPPFYKRRPDACFCAAGCGLLLRTVSRTC